MATMLFAITYTDVPLSPNPAIDRNATHFILQWSPPFLWPGKRIEYYIINLYDSYNTAGSTHYRVNVTSVISVLETFAVNVSSTMNANLQCTAVDFTFSLAAVVSESTPEAFNASFTIAPTGNLGNVVSFSLSTGNEMINVWLSINHKHDHTK